MAANEPLPSKFLDLGDNRDPNLLRVNLVGLGTIVLRETRRVVRIWVQTIVPPAITMTLYFVIFGTLIGQRIGEMGGVPYMTFIAPSSCAPKATVWRNSSWGLWSARRRSDRRSGSE